MPKGEKGDRGGILDKQPEAVKTAREDRGGDGCGGGGVGRDAT